MHLSLIIPSFIAGLLTFLAPCTLPLVPGYLGFISGVSLDDLKDPNFAKKVRSKIFLNGLLFILGFTLIFVALGILAGFFGGRLVASRLWFSKIGGLFVISFGLFMLGVLKIPFLARRKTFFKIPIFENGRPLNSLILGSAFAFGWTPCIGPILGSVLLLASTSATVFEGAFLLLVFSLGLAIPFLGIALMIGSASRYISRFSKFLGIVSIIGGVFLVIMGILLVTNNLGLLVPYGYQLLKFINYDRLLDYF